jgi:uncharacterized protein YdeI (YjbR/CyaY-like superfamily)
VTRDPRVDAYIARQADFARPILDHLRGLVHAASPQVEESIKWSMPAFLYAGKPLANMAAFKAHATFGFWQASQILDGHAAGEKAMGQFGRITTLANLPPDEQIVAWARKGIALIDAGVKPVREKSVKPAPDMPADFAAALAAAPAAKATYDAFPPSCRREYLEWVTEAKRPETRARRIAESVAMMAAGKRRHWKYENC